VGNVEPEVLDFYTQNETIFRPMFSTAEEMQGFVDEFVKNKQAIEVVAKGGPTPSDDAIKAMNAAIAKEKKMLEQLNVGLSEGALKQLFPNLPFKSRDEWGDILIKRDLTEAAQRLFIDKVDGAAQWYAVTPANLVKNRYSQSGGTAVPINQRTRDMKGIGTEEFYGGPTSVDSKGKHYTSTVEKALKRAAKENNSEFKIIKVDGVGDVFAVKLTPEMLLPHKTHRKKGGMVYTPEIIDIFEAA
jgi:phage-related protein